MVFIRTMNHTAGNSSEHQLAGHQNVKEAPGKTLYKLWQRSTLPWQMSCKGGNLSPMPKGEALQFTVASLGSSQPHRPPWNHHPDNVFETAFVDTVSSNPISSVGVKPPSSRIQVWSHSYPKGDLPKPGEATADYHFQDENFMPDVSVKVLRALRLFIFWHMDLYKI